MKAAAPLSFEIPASALQLHVGLPAVIPGCVIALSWNITDGQGEIIDQLAEADAREFFVSEQELLPAMMAGLLGLTAGQSKTLHLEPEEAFGEYESTKVYLIPRSEVHPLLPTPTLGQVVLMADLLKTSPTLSTQTHNADNTNHSSNDEVLVISDIYPEHLVLDGNHPLSGTSLNLALKIHTIRAASPEESNKKSVSGGFFHLRSLL